MPEEINDFTARPTALSETMEGTVDKSTTPTLDDVKSKLSDDLSAATEVVKDTANSAIQKAQDTVGEQKNFAARQVGAIASALQKVGAELESSDEPQVARYAKQIGDSAHAFAKNMEGRDLGDIAVMAETFGRKQPLAFLGVAAIAGLAASRFLISSGTRRSSPSIIHDQNSTHATGFGAQMGGADNG